MNVVAYVRANSADQVEIDKSQLLGYTQNMGWKIKDFFIDVGFSGLDFDRPELQNLLRRTFFDDQIDGVLITEEKSLSRDVTTLITIKEKMDISNKTIFCVN